jgi:hypothetical protein
MFFGSVWFSTPVFNTGFQRRFTTDSREKRFGIGLVSLCYRSYFSLIAVSCFFTHQDPFNTFSILDILHPTCSFFSTSKDLRAQRNIDGAHSGCKTTIRINVVCWNLNEGLMTVLKGIAIRQYTLLTIKRSRLCVSNRKFAVFRYACRNI